MKNIVLLCASFLITMGAFAQITFTEAIGGPSTDQAISAEATSDGGYIVVGWTKSFGAGSWDIYLVKVNSIGAIQWARTYGGPGDEVDCYVHQTFDGGFIITARTNSFNVGSSDVYLIKTSATGDAQWTKSIGGSDWDEGHSAIQTKDSGYVHVGFTTSFGAGDHDIYLVRSDKNGSTQWTKSFGGSGVDNGHLIISALNGGYIILGETTSFGAGGRDYYLVKTDVNGNIEWSKTYGGSGNEFGWDIKATTDSCYILAGYTNSFGAGGNDVYLIKIDMKGNVLWSKTYGNATNETGLAIRQTTDGGYVVTGETSAISSDSADVYVIKTDKDGMPEWSRTFGGAGDDGSQSIQQTSDKGYFICGYTNSLGEGDWDFYLIKTDSMGYTSSCNLSSPVVIVSNTTNTTMVSNPPTQVSSGGVTSSQNSFVYSGGVGTYCTGKVTTVKDIAGNNPEINIYPNPAQRVLELTHPSGMSAVEIYDHLGQIVYRQQTQNNTKELIDVSAFPVGVYQIKCISTGKMVVKKFVKME